VATAPSAALPLDEDAVVDGVGEPLPLPPPPSPVADADGSTSPALVEEGPLLLLASLLDEEAADADAETVGDDDAAADGVS
jgi:hypothetical protein